MLLADSVLRGTQCHRYEVAMLNILQIAIGEVVITLAVAFFVGGYMEWGLTWGIISGAIACVVAIALYVVWLLILERLENGFKNNFGAS